MSSVVKREFVTTSERERETEKEQEQVKERPGVAVFFQP